jgi:putative DNA primase/helicase
MTRTVLDEAEERERARRAARAAQKPSANGDGGKPVDKSKLVLQRLDSVKAKPVHYFVPDKLPAGKLILIAGDGGNCKSVVTLSVAADHSRGRPAMGQVYTAPVSESLFFTCEDDPADTLVPRLLALDADLTKIHHLKTAIGPDGKNVSFSLLDIDLIDQALNLNPNIKFVVIDPVSAYIGRTGRNENQDAELRSILDPLSELAAKHDVTIVLIKHLTKNEKTRAMHRISGSQAYLNAVRVAYLIAKTPIEDGAIDDGRRVILPLKNNLTKNRHGLAFRPIGIPVTQAATIVAKNCQHLSQADQQQLAEQLFTIEWLGDSDDDPDTVLTENRLAGRPKIKECADFIRGFVGHLAWPSAEVEAAANDARFSTDAFYKAKAALKLDGLHNQKRGLGAWWMGFGDPVNWSDRPNPIPP